MTVTPQLADEVRPYLVAAVEAGYGRLWMIREVRLRRDRLRHAASRIHPILPNETPTAYFHRIDRYVRVLTPQRVWADSSRLPVTLGNPSSKQVTQGNQLPRGHEVTRRQRPRPVPWASGED